MIGRLYRHLYILSAIALALAAPSAKAQEAGHDVCQDVGASAPEPLGDREGHAITTGLFSCRVTEGLLAGAVETGNGIWEWDGTKATQLSGNGVARRPGAILSFQALDGKLELTMSEGKPTGWTASGHTAVNLAAGGAASMMGKTATWTAKSTGPFQFEINYTFK